MKRILRMVVFSFFIWLIPFAVSVAIFRLKTSNRALFESIMPVVLTLCGVVFTVLYFRKSQAHFFRDGVLLGVIFLGMSVGLDLCLFMEGPMKMPFGSYLADIGLTYLIYPIITIGFAYLLALKRHPDSELDA